ncbi:rCG35937 [Rattus norvegicus]|uniref:RCG35937 n=1 Tax=Rattus norvegicus TaxID=10116 RepID=A6IJS3_RAT|nr:rCG35937 [Rattus norvegicus]
MCMERCWTPFAPGTGRLNHHGMWETSANIFKPDDDFKC